LLSFSSVLLMRHVGAARVVFVHLDFFGVRIDCLAVTWHRDPLVTSRLARTLAEIARLTMPYATASRAVVP
jgi:hypothetical protein